MIYDFKQLPHIKKHAMSVEEFARRWFRHHELAGVIQLGDPAHPVGPAVVAEVNARNMGGAMGWQGRWIAHCECGGAEYVDFDCPIFMCCSCWNESTGNKWRKVALPKNRQAIEAELVKRPGKNRHWKAGESVEKLKAENRGHGL